MTAGRGAGGALLKLIWAEVASVCPVVSLRAVMVALPAFPERTVVEKRPTASALPKVAPKLSAEPRLELSRTRWPGGTPSRRTVALMLRSTEVGLMVNCGAVGGT